MATGQRGDLLDLIAACRSLDRFCDVAREAEAFLLVQPAASGARAAARPPSEPSTARRADLARRIFAAGLPIAGSLVEAYLAGRGLTDLAGADCLRFHPRCRHRSSGQGPGVPKPAMLAAVTDLDGVVTGIHRTWLDRRSADRVERLDRRALGRLLGGAVRFGSGGAVWAVGEGIETMLSLKAVAPALPVAAALSAAHLRAVQLPRGLARLYIACDNDAAGRTAAGVLADRAIAQGVAPIVLTPQLDDLNEDLARLGPSVLSAWIKAQVHSADRGLFD